MPGPYSFEYDHVKSTIDSGPQEESWVNEEFGTIDLSDDRLDRRLIKTARELAKSPLAPINEACGTWACTKGAYRLFDNDKADSKEILRPHQDATINRMIAHGGTVLAVQDTVFFSYGQHPKTRGLGPIGKGESSKDRGLIMHNALAFSTSGVPLGILSQQIWARDETPDESRLEKIVRLQCTPIEEKESFKWILALRETVALAPPDVRIVTVADRESDFFEFMTEAKEFDAHYLIRARIDRKLVSDESGDCARISEALLEAPNAGLLTISIPSNGKRKARTAIVTVRFAEITIQPPQKRGNAKNTGSSDPISISVISAQEVDPPKDIEALSWVLLTNLQVKNYDSAVEKISWYAKRWGIETWHKVLKSGCKVEDCLLETADRLKRFLALFSIIGCRLMYITYLARVSPDIPSTDVFSKMEIDALTVRMEKKFPIPGKPISLKKAVQMIAGLGGHLGRKCDGEAGVTALWRGLTSLSECVEMMSAMMSSARSDSS